MSSSCIKKCCWTSVMQILPPGVPPLLLSLQKKNKSSPGALGGLKYFRSYLQGLKKDDIIHWGPLHLLLWPQLTSVQHHMPIDLHQLMVETLQIITLITLNYKAFGEWYHTKPGVCKLNEGQFESPRGSWVLATRLSLDCVPILWWGDKLTPQASLTTRQVGFHFQLNVLVLSEQAETKLNGKL